MIISQEIVQVLVILCGDEFSETGYEYCYYYYLDF